MSPSEHPESSGHHSLLVQLTAPLKLKIPFGATVVIIGFLSFLLVSILMGFVYFKAQNEDVEKFLLQILFFLIVLLIVVVVLFTGLLLRSVIDGLGKKSLFGLGIVIGVILVAFFFSLNLPFDPESSNKSSDGQETKSQTDSTSTSNSPGKPESSSPSDPVKNSPSEPAPSMSPPSAMRPLSESVPNPPGKPESSAPSDPVKNFPSEPAPSMSPPSAMSSLSESTPNTPREEESSRPQSQTPNQEPEKGTDVPPPVAPIMQQTVKMSPSLESVPEAVYEADGWVYVGEYSGRRWKKKHFSWDDDDKRLPQSGNKLTATGLVNLRKNPGQKASIIGHILPGEQVQVLESETLSNSYHWVKGKRLQEKQGSP